MNPKKPEPDVRKAISLLVSSTERRKLQLAVKRSGEIGFSAWARKVLLQAAKAQRAT